MKKKRTFIFLLALLSFTCTVMAQQRMITGTVKDASGEPVIGATVVVKNLPSIGTATDVNGRFTLKVPQNAKLVAISFIGMESQVVPITGKPIDVVLKDNAVSLKEVVAIGYGTVQKRDLTGAVATVSSKTLQEIPVTSAAQAITGRLAGVQVTTTEGSPDAQVMIRVRGGGSITQDNSPLYIVDGFPVNSISDISPSDIQSIDVLKDASSTAIYGSRGANGVIIITTKSGIAGKVSVSINAYAGVNNLAKKLKMMSPYEYTMWQYELDQSSTFTGYYGAYDDLDIYKSKAPIDWEDQVFGRTGVQQYYNVDINGGSKTDKYNLGITRSGEKGIMIGSDYGRTNVDFKFNTKINDHLNVDFNTRYARTVIDGAGTSSGSGSNTFLRNAMKYAPVHSLISQSSYVNDQLAVDPTQLSLLFNPVDLANDTYQRQTNQVLNLNGALNWNIVKPLTFRSEFGYEFDNNRKDNVWGPSTPLSKNNGGLPIGEITTLGGVTWRIANTLTFNQNNIFPGQNLNVLLGQEASSYSYRQVVNESMQFPSGMDAASILAMMNLGTAQPTITTESQPYNMSSFFGRANYSINDKYLASLTFRADGTSKFAPGHQWGYFPSAAVAWRLSEENFLKGKISWLDNLKLRLSMGTAGNSRISDGLWQLTYGTTDSKGYYINENLTSVLVPGTTLSNPNLKWETTLTRNVGWDIGVLNSRLNATIDAYWNTTFNLLLQQPIPANTGYTTQMQNFGRTSNRGLEVTLDAHIIETPKFSLNATFNIAFNKNRVDEFRYGDATYKTYSSGWNGTSQPLDDYIIQQGQPVGQMYGYVYDGMYTFNDFHFDSSKQKWILNGDATGATTAAIAGLFGYGNYFGPGSMKVKDINKDGTIDANDKTVIGDANPIHTGGFTLNARYINFDLSAFFNWSYGNKIYNANKIDYTSDLLSRKYQNLLDIMSLANGRFTTIDPTTGQNIFYGQYANPARLQQINQKATMWTPFMTIPPLTSFDVEDGSFLRLSTLTLGYSLPKKLTSKLMMTSFRIYITAYNVFCLTKYSGFDPEVSTRNSPPVTPGVDYSAYPKSRSFIGGVNINF
ncbi:SusC/RagA family TonB-linked outer membrane protein [Microbacter margulisiae]|uniref:TonB-linked SusC/RagA family outer membrane protein n=1 Tax=Microbacter margulisiae TaxID=1350067 RepID=A0A7W5DRW8_9PORP|nr:TonB-dependent receptor [Microbacter margulisiae]MBB3187964.1 TonB-linked SusC/RagA family outer membrane protein [Microbacter margulisiae]